MQCFVFIINSEEQIRQIGAAEETLEITITQDRDLCFPTDIPDAASPNRFPSNHAGMVRLHSPRCGDAPHLWARNYRPAKVKITPTRSFLSFIRDQRTESAEREISEPIGCRVRIESFATSHSGELGRDRFNFANANRIDPEASAPKTVRAGYAD